MASANDSQGLKIAVAIFVSLTVILAVTAYFLYSEYDKANESLTAAQSELSTAKQQATQANTNLARLRDHAGYQTKTDIDAITKAMHEDQQAIVNALETELQEAQAALERAQQSGATASEIARYQDNIAQLKQRIAAEAQQQADLRQTIMTLADLAINQTQLSSTLAADLVAVRNQLERVNEVNESELTTQEKAAQQAKATLSEEHTKYENLFDEQRLRIGDLQTKVADLTATRDDLSRQIERLRGDYDQERKELIEQINYLQNQADKDANVLENPDGYITNVDYRSDRVRVNITRNMGARPQMLFSVFDSEAPGLPTDDPKARIKLIEVTERDSIATIEEQFNKTEPIRYGDQVYSPAWSPQEPQKFALLGKIDINRDGRDDRDDLKRLIRASGGSVVYDLPPPGTGQEQGELTPLVSWYVIDERDPIESPSNKRAVDEMTRSQEAFNQARSDAIEEARRLGIRPMRLSRLLPSLGYSFNMMMPGQLEAADTAAIEDLIRPEGMTAPMPGTEAFERAREEGEQNAAPMPFN